MGQLPIDLEQILFILKELRSYRRQQISHRRREEMILKYCMKCSYHELTEINAQEYSRCGKENCLSIYAKCITEEAVRQFIHRNEPYRIEAPTSALDILYSSI